MTVPPLARTRAAKSAGTAPLRRKRCLPATGVTARTGAPSGAIERAGLATGSLHADRTAQTNSAPPNVWSALRKRLMDHPGDNGDAMLWPDEVTTIARTRSGRQPVYRPGAISGR